MDNVPNGDMKILMSDMNAELGEDNTGRELTMGREALGEMNDNGEHFSDFCPSMIVGREALGEMNDNGELFSDFCAFNDLVNEMNDNGELFSDFCAFNDLVIGVK
ncbi:unnamed protein product [Trichobilharzia regenti]|nr:unnamed protein product [Trichobilharzia regenti]